MQEGAPGVSQRPRPLAPANEDLLEIAQKIGHEQKNRELRLILMGLGLALLVILVIGLIAIWQLSGLLDDLEDQGKVLQAQAEENRDAFQHQQDQMTDLLLSIQDRLVPRSDVVGLQNQTRKLRKQVKTLTAETNDLQRSIAALTRAVAASGG